MNGLTVLSGLPDSAGVITVVIAAISAVRGTLRPLAMTLCLCVLAVSRDASRRSDVLVYVSLLREESTTKGRRVLRRRRREE